ncbi:threonylcarbamoyl-AMP synthase [Polymorphobacter arshaanensis]|uniref:Threonylcarbamoyl-AMP synthase n=1 Tax=Glacieibacterium arshaanense TaxID=2511025 RepID=A0A4Y9EQY5_9SPHN|nr:L-threonylcarbamoyladenylate synthase [Polymorphobacter arshaanensis]TFU06026.1 threonylcarbamoyl-AMP synthase [Polymorphobacter arshaanensis]
MEHDTQIVAPDAAGMARAVALLAAGEVVALPTETVYGLAAVAANGAAVARIFAAKGRPSFNPLIVHVADATQAATLVEVNATAAALMAAHWPGPLTLVLPLKPDAPVAGLVSAGLPTLAVRCPAHPVMQAAIAAVGPLAAPSANASGKISATHARHVLASLRGRIPLVVDGGPSQAGVESTIIGVDGDLVTLLRPGAVAAAPDWRPSTSSSITAPGQLASHYAPEQPVRLGALTAAAHEFHIGFGAVRGDLSLSPAGDTIEAAANLFEALHVAQASGRAAIAVAPVPMAGLGVAINDRLARAAAERHQN